MSWADYADELLLRYLTEHLQSRTLACTKSASSYGSRATSMSVASFGVTDVFLAKIDGGN